MAEFSVRSPPREQVPSVLRRRHLDRCGAGEVRERRLGREAERVAGVGEDAGRGHWADTMNAHQVRSALGENGFGAFGDLDELDAESSQVTDHLSCDRFPHDFARRGWCDTPQREGGFLGVEVGLRAPGYELPQDGVQLVTHAGALCDEAAPAFVENPQHIGVVLDDDGVSVALQRRHTSGSCGIDAIVLRRFPRESCRTRAVDVDGTSTTSPPSFTSHSAR